MYHDCPPVLKITHSLKPVDYLHVQADNPWYNYCIVAHEVSMLIFAFVVLVISNEQFINAKKNLINHTLCIYSLSIFGWEMHHVKLLTVGFKHDCSWCVLTTDYSEHSV